MGGLPPHCQKDREIPEVHEGQVGECRSPPTSVCPPGADWYLYFKNCNSKITGYYILETLKEKIADAYDINFLGYGDDADMDFGFWALTLPREIPEVFKN